MGRGKMRRALAAEEERARQEAWRSIGDFAEDLIKTYVAKKDEDKMGRPKGLDKFMNNKTTGLSGTPLVDAEIGDFPERLPKQIALEVSPELAKAAADLGVVIGDPPAAPDPDATDPKYVEADWTELPKTEAAVGEAANLSGDVQAYADAVKEGTSAAGQESAPTREITPPLVTYKPPPVPDAYIVTRSFKGRENRDPPLQREFVFVYDDDVFQEIMHYVRKATDYEVSGWCKVVIESEPTTFGKPDRIVFHVVECLLPKQVGFSAGTDIEPIDVALAEDAARDHPGEMRLWWHSHVDMGVFWSGTDFQNMMDNAAQGWILATVFNQKFEQRSAIAIGKPFPTIIDDIPMRVQRRIPGACRAAWDKKFEANVTKKYGGGSTTYTPPHQPPYTYKRDDAVREAHPRADSDRRWNGAGYNDAEDYDPAKNKSNTTRFLADGKSDAEKERLARQATSQAESSQNSAVMRRMTIPSSGSESNITADQLVDFVLEYAVLLGFPEREAVDWADHAEKLTKTRRWPLHAIKNTLIVRMRDRAIKNGLKINEEKANELTNPPQAL